MNRSVLIIQPNDEVSADLAGIFRERGDKTTLVSSIKAAGEYLQISLPDILLVDITLLGRKWQTAVPTLKKRFQRTTVLFTYSSDIRLPEDHTNNLVELQVLTLPITEERIDKALSGKLTKYDILEPLQKRPRLTYPIRFLINWPFLLLAILFSLAATFITTRIVFDSAEERFANQLIEAGKLSSEWMVIEEDNLLESLRLIINTVGLPAEVTNLQSDNLHRLIYPLAVNAQIEDIEILNLDGVAIYSLQHRSGSSIEDYQVSSGTDYFQATELIQNIREQKVDEFGDKHAAALSPPWGKVFYVAGPISLEGEIVGIALVGKALPSLVKEIRETTLAQTTLYSLDGTVLATTFITSEDLSLDYVQQVLSNQDSFAPSVNKTIADIAYTEIHAPWEIREDLDIGIIGVSLAQNYLVHTSWITRTQIFIALGLFITFILLLGRRISYRISKPLESLAIASEEVSKGNFLVTLESPGSKEVAILNQSFNEMLKNLELSRSDLIQAIDNSLEGWSRALSLRDHPTDEHSKRVVELAVALASEMGISDIELENIHRGAMLHDIGKVGIPDEILRKAGDLTDDEWALMKKHPLLAVDMLQPVQFLQDALDIPLYHHERWDGTGYPYGLKGERIPLPARIFAVADVFDALVSNRPYRNAWSKEEAAKYLINNKGVQFDPEIVDIFIKLLVERKQL